MGLLAIATVASHQNLLLTNWTRFAQDSDFSTINMSFVFLIVFGVMLVMITKHCDVLARLVFSMVACFCIAVIFILAQRTAFFCAFVFLAIFGARLLPGKRKSILIVSVCLVGCFFALQLLFLSDDSSLAQLTLV